MVNECFLGIKWKKYVKLMSKLLVTDHKDFYRTIYQINQIEIKINRNSYSGCEQILSWDLGESHRKN